jgi:hypothetical protein
MHTTHHRRAPKGHASGWRKPCCARRSLHRPRVFLCRDPPCSAANGMENSYCVPAQALLVALSDAAQRVSTCSSSCLGTRT